MADYQTTVFPTGGYAAQHKGWNHQGHMTPNFEIMEGMRVGTFHPAPYLPTVRLEKSFEDYVVIGAGKAVALDSNGWLVPAGLKLALAAGGSNGPQYTATDIAMGILNAAGDTPTVGEYVITSMAAESITVGHCLGAASYDVYLLSGSDPANPATYRFHNYNRQSGVAVLTDYLLEFPVEPLKRTAATFEETVVTPGASHTATITGVTTVVESTVKVFLNNDEVHVDDWSFGDGTGAGGADQVIINLAVVADDEILIQYKYSESFYSAPWAGMATWKGSAVPGGKVTFDMESNWVMYAATSFGDTTAVNQATNIAAAIAKTLDVVGQITAVHTNYPKQFLDRVKTAFDSRLHGEIVDGVTGEAITLDRMAGSATDGLPQNIYFAGGDGSLGVVRFNLNIT